MATPPSRPVAARRPLERTHPRRDPRRRLRVAARQGRPRGRRRTSRPRTPGPRSGPRTWPTCARRSSTRSRPAPTRPTCRCRPGSAATGTTAAPSRARSTARSCRVPVARPGRLDSPEAGRGLRRRPAGAARRAGAARPQRARRGPRLLLAGRLVGQPRRAPARLLHRRGRRRALHGPGQGPAHRRAAARRDHRHPRRRHLGPRRRDFYYTTVDESWRPDKVWRHRLGTDPGRRRAGPPRARRAVLGRRRPHPQRPLPGDRVGVQDHHRVPLARRRRPRTDGEFVVFAPRARPTWSTTSSTR